MHLRPHHLLCIQKFTGHGYDADFTAQMTAVAAALRENPQQPLTIVQGCDVLCQRCPYQANNLCASWEKVALMDEAVLQACALAYGEKVCWAKASSKARETLLQTAAFEQICACCQWFTLCQQTEVDGE